LAAGIGRGGLIEDNSAAGIGYNRAICTSLQRSIVEVIQQAVVVEVEEKEPGDRNRARWEKQKSGSRFGCWTLPPGQRHTVDKAIVPVPTVTR